LKDSSILYFHGFASSSDSNKAKLLKKYIAKKYKKVNLLIPDLDNHFKTAIEQIENLIKNNPKPISFIGSSLGGYYAAYFASINNSKAILINPAIPPLDGFDKYLGKNENYSTGEKFNINKQDIEYLRSISFQQYINSDNTLVLLESGDDVLNYIETTNYFLSSYIDINFGGSHSYDTFEDKLDKICSFLKI